MIAFWKYDIYPYLLWGKVSRENNDGKVYVGAYQGWVTPQTILPDAQGDTVAKILEGLRKEYAIAQENLLKEYVSKLPYLEGLKVGMNSAHVPLLTEVKAQPEQQKEGTKTLEAPKSCIDCLFHNVIPDPDPDDSFCSDDVAVVCSLSKNPAMDKSSWYLADRQPYRLVTSSCRPYNTRKESDVPTWCPERSKTLA